MKEKMIALACITIAPLALAQTNVTQPGAERSSKGDTTSAASVASAPTGQTVSVNTFIPGKSIAVTPSVASQPVTYMLSENVRYADAAGNTLDPSNIRSGARVRLEVSGTGTTRTVDRIVLVAPQ
ncbi:MAG TPA: hypothetical protein VFO30_07245 [Chthoniobacterales bacterium]|nr:hypothetical protein [Chthoniobacterales bacterium]